MSSPFAPPRTQVTPIPSDPRVFRGLPWLSPACSRRWLGDRWFVFSHPPLHAARVSIVSSRLSQRLDLEHWWFALLRTAVLQTDPTHALLPVISGTAPAECLIRACQIFQRTPLHIQLPEHTGLPDHFPRDPAAAQAWLNLTQHTLSPLTTPTHPPHLFVSPLLPGAPPDGWHDFRQAIPLADRLLFALATRIIVLRCRSGGHISQLIHHHLHDSPRATVPTMVAADEHSQFPDVLTQRCAGWIPWLCLPSPHSNPADTPLPRSADSHSNPPRVPTALTSTHVSQSSQSIAPPSRSADHPRSPKDSTIDNPLTAPQNWICHWTRAAIGPWPGETRDQFLDQCLLASPSADRSALQTLLRILRESRLRASADAIRGGHAVTAFTQVPLQEFRVRRIFRPHRRRYDFEPWGLAVRQSTLTALGARPVIYGTEELWHTLQPADQPFFQKIALDGSINAPAEREWRLPHDLLLNQLPHRDLVLFVDSADDAAVVADCGPWQVLVLPPIPAPDIPAQPSPSLVSDRRIRHTPDIAPPPASADDERLPAPAFVTEICQGPS
ncbi:MAG: hypothetical protein ACKO2P_03025 [Planctomycetota bacterium]